MTDPIPSLVAGDVVLEHVVQVVVAGLAVRLESNAQEVVSAARLRYAAPVDTQPAPACRLQIQVQRGGEASPGGMDAMDVRWRFPDRDHAVVSAPGLAATVDMAGGNAVVHVDESFVRNEAQFRRTVIEGILLTLLTRRDRHPIHAAALRAGDAALLLHGPSGVGKSTLAYVAYRAGIDVLADDAARVQLEPEFRVWGDGVRPRIHLAEGARDEFSELRGHTAQRLSSDSVRKLAVELRSPSAPWSPFARAARVCLLARRGGAVAVRDASPKEIRDTLINAPEAAFDLAPEQRQRVVTALAVAGGWHLTLSHHAVEAIPHLQTMLAQSGASK